MSERSNIVYVYDGSYEGLLCCIFESFEKKQLPLDIRPENDEQITLYSVKSIDTDISKANRVQAGIRKKASNDVYSHVELGYYTCHPKKEMLILDFVRLSLRYGRNVLSMLTNTVVNDLSGAVRALTRESHQLKGFVRFSVYNGVMTAVIEPKNFVLSLLAPHFCDRYANDAFMIYDKAHGFALVYKPRQSAIIPIDDYEQPNADEEELKFRSLWKLFYDTIAIKERYNPKCRMSHMQKRYWKHLTEMDGSPQLPEGKRDELDGPKTKQLQ